MSIATLAAQSAIFLICAVVVSRALDADKVCNRCRRPGEHRQLGVHWEFVEAELVDDHCTVAHCVEGPERSLGGVTQAMEEDAIFDYIVGCS